MNLMFINVVVKKYSKLKCHRRLASCPEWSVCINGLQSKVLVRLAESRMLARRRRWICHTVFFSPKWHFLHKDEHFIYPHKNVHVMNDKYLYIFMFDVNDNTVALLWVFKCQWRHRAPKLNVPKHCRAKGLWSLINIRLRYVIHWNSMSSSVESDRPHAARRE